MYCVWRKKDTSKFNKDCQKKDGLNPRCKVCSRQWHHKNKDKVQKYQAEYYSQNKEYHSDKAKKYRKQNRKKLNDNKRNWHVENLDKVEQYRIDKKLNYRAYAANRRARLKANGGTHTSEEIESLYSYQCGKCAICKTNLSDYHVDHIMPIAKGGSNSLENLQITCPSCNFKKNDSDPVEFMQQQGFLL